MLSFCVFYCILTTQPANELSCPARKQPKTQTKKIPLSKKNRATSTHKSAIFFCNFFRFFQSF